METPWGRLDMVKPLIGDTILIFWQFLKGSWTLMGKTLDLESEDLGLRLSPTVE